MAFGANTAGATFIDIRGDLSGFRRDLVSAQGIAVAGGNRIGSALHRRMQSWNHRIGASLGAGLRTGFRLGTVAAGAWAAYSVNAASDVGEAINKANVIFGKNRAEILAWSKTTANAFGISRIEALGAASSFGAMLDTAGVAGDELAEMSSDLVELAADMASFNNEDPSAMLERLRSGLAGEAEPLRRFGVFLSEARMQQEALNMGLSDGSQELTEAQKLQARYALILKDTTKQQGDFARTSEAMPNQLRRLRAAFSDASAELGQKLLPVATEIVTWLADELPAAIKTVSRFMKGWSVAWDQTVSDVGDGVAGLVGLFADFTEFFANSAGKIVSAASFAFGWMPGLGKRIRESEKWFHAWTDGLVADLRKQEERFRHWGESVSDILANARESWEGFRHAVKTNTLPMQAAFSFVPNAGGGDPGGTPTGRANVAMAAVPGYQVITSGYRPGDTDSFHSTPPPNNAVDIGGSNLAGVFNYLASRYGGSVRELIYGNTIIQHGSRGHYSPDDHWDHVHLADMGAIIQGPALIAQGNITEAHIPLSGPGAKGLKISGTLHIPGIGKAILRGATVAVNSFANHEDAHSSSRQPIYE